MALYSSFKFRISQSCKLFMILLMIFPLEGICFFVAPQLQQKHQSLHSDWTNNNNNNNNIQAFKTSISLTYSSTTLWSSASSSLPSSSSSSPSSSYIATCIPGLAHILAEELREIHPDITNISVSGNAAVTFSATRKASLYALCWVRTAHRLLELIATTSDDDDDVLLYDRNDLHAFIASLSSSNKINIKALLGNGKGGLLTLSVKTILNNPKDLPQDLSHSHYTALTIKNALCDVVRDLRGDRPNVDIDNPDVPLVAMLLGCSSSSSSATTTNNNPGNNNNGAICSLYRSLHPPGSLHKRGYRQGGAIHKAAMKESLAAGLLREAGWHSKIQAVKAQTQTNANSRTGEETTQEVPLPLPLPLQLIDPMAGSGSFVLEAAMMAADISPGIMRIRCNVPNHKLPPVTRWKSDDDEEEDVETMWKQILLEATQRAKDGLQWIRSGENNNNDNNNNNIVQIWANDIHSGALDILDQSLFAAGLQNLVQVTNMDCYDLKLSLHDNDHDDTKSQNSSSSSVMVVTNPPWGVRLTEDIEQSWEGLRHFIRDTCPSGTEAWVLSGHKGVTGLLKLKRDRMIPIQTGDQTLRWIQYTIFRGNDHNDSNGSNADNNNGKDDASTRTFLEETTKGKDNFQKRLKTKIVPSSSSHRHEHDHQTFKRTAGAATTATTTKRSSIKTQKTFSTGGGAAPTKKKQQKTSSTKSSTRGNVNEWLVD